MKHQSIDTVFLIPENKVSFMSTNSKIQEWKSQSNPVCLNSSVKVFNYFLVKVYKDPIWKSLLFIFYLEIFKIKPEQDFARKCSVMTNFSLEVSICF